MNTNEIQSITILQSTDYFQFELQRRAWPKTLLLIAVHSLVLQTNKTQNYENILTKIISCTNLYCRVR